MRIRYKSAASRYAAAERRAQAERDAGIPDRDDADRRCAWELDLRAVGGPYWVCEPRRGYVSYRVLDAGTRERVMCAPAKSILAAAQEATPRMLSGRAVG